MTSITFDTLKFVELSTKSDLRELELPINSEIKLIRWMVGLSLAILTGILAMLFKLFFAPV
ncbi:MAG: hypothetical protein RLZ92_213 [Pseudomonadota bacterium]|jgi:hypothetical protein